MVNSSHETVPTQLYPRCFGLLNLDNILYCIWRGKIVWTFWIQSCKKIILKGEWGCSNGDKCRFTHPCLCVGCLKNNTCHRKKCYLYHVTGSSRPNLSKNNRGNEKLKATHVQDCIHSTSESTISINSPKQTYAEVVN